MNVIRVQGSGEEVANAASHGLGCVLAVLSLPLLMAADMPLVRRGDAWGTLVFVATMTLLYLASALYHAAPDGPAKARLQRVDHAAIFIFIAGSWTPFALRSGVSWTMFALIWGIALAGALLKLTDRLQHRTASTTLYVAFGWLTLAAVGPLAEPTGLRSALPWLMAGGAAYSIGTVFFVLDQRLRYGHLVWHLFVLSGSACHFAAVLRPLD